MLRQFQALPLIVGALAAIETLGLGGHAFIDQLGDGLAVFEDKGHVPRPHFQHSAATATIRAEARIEEARIVRAEFAQLDRKSVV